MCIITISHGVFSLSTLLSSSANHLHWGVYFTVRKVKTQFSVTNKYVGQCITCILVRFLFFPRKRKIGNFTCKVDFQKWNEILWFNLFTWIIINYKWLLTRGKNYLSKSEPSNLKLTVQIYYATLKLETPMQSILKNYQQSASLNFSSSRIRSWCNYIAAKKYQYRNN